MSELSERIKQARKHLGLTQAEFAKTINAKADRVKSLETGRAKEITSLEASLMVNNLYFSLNWLATGEGEMLEQRTQAKQFDDSRGLPSGYALMPAYSSQTNTGYDSPLHSERVVDHLAFSESWLTGRLLNKNKLCLIEAKGDSMEPTLLNKDLLLVNMQQTELSDGIYIIQYNNHLLIKRIQAKQDGTITIKSDNPVYESEKLLPDSEHNMQVIGEVVWFGRAIT